MDCGLNMPPGFRFHPTDEELVRDYLVRQCVGLPLAAPIVAEVDLYRFDPWQLPEMARYGEKEWYFFSSRDRKYPNGTRPNRAAGTGYWKATGADKPIGHPKTLGIKKALVFYAGRSPRSVKTNWIMHEYRLSNVDHSTAGKKNKLRLDDWVLCRIYNKKGYIEKYTTTEPSTLQVQEVEQDMKPEVSPTIRLQHYPQSVNNWPVNTETRMVEASKSVPKLQPESSCSELVNSPEFMNNNKEVQSESKWDDFDKSLEKGFDFSMVGLLNDDPFGFQTQLQMNQFGPQQGAFSYYQQKPF